MLRCAVLAALAVSATMAQQAALMAPIHFEGLQASYSVPDEEDQTPMAAMKNVGALRVTENSGVCGASTVAVLEHSSDTVAETTAGVYQASGYADIAEDKSLWYTFT